MQYPALRWNLCDFHDHYDHDEVEERDSESTWSAEGFLSETDSLSTLTSCTCRYTIYHYFKFEVFFYNMKSMLQSTDIQNSLKFKTRYMQTIR